MNEPINNEATIATWPSFETHVKWLTDEAIDIKTTSEDCPEGIYALMLGGFEKPMLRKVLNYTKYNQTMASKLLGISRGTLRKKMKRYGL